MYDLLYYFVMFQLLSNIVGFTYIISQIVKYIHDANKLEVSFNSGHRFALYENEFLDMCLIKIYWQDYIDNIAPLKI